MEDECNEKLKDARIRAILVTFFAAHRDDKKYIANDYRILAKVLIIEDLDRFRLAYLDYLYTDKKWLTAVGISTTTFDATRVSVANAEANSVVSRVRKWIPRMPTYVSDSDDDTNDSESKAADDSDEDM